MEYLPQYKVGDPLFRTLAELRHQANSTKNWFQYSQKAPHQIQPLQTLLKKIPNIGEYKVLQTETLQKIQTPPTIEPSKAAPFFDTSKPIAFPQTFLFTTTRGSVLGDGTCLLDEATILEETTTDFHRKSIHHHLLSAKRIPKAKKISKSLAVISSPGSNNYFHWTLVSLPRLLILHEAHIEPDCYLIDHTARFHKEWIKQLEIPAGKIIQPVEATHIQPTELIIPSFMGTASLPSLKSIQMIRSFIPTEPINSPKKIFISRAHSHRRKVLNESVLESFLKLNEFVTIHLDKPSVKEQMELFSNAEIIISPHGAELTNLIYCSPKTKIIELFSPYYINPCFQRLASLCQLNYSAIIGTGGNKILAKKKDMHWVWKNMIIDLNLLKKALN